MKSNEIRDMPCLSDRHTESACGFTIVELLISMAIGLIIITALTSTFVTQRQSYDVQQQITAAVQMARAAMDMMSREIRLAGYDPTGAGFNGIPYDTSQLQVLADLDGDGATTSSNENIAYAFYGETDQIKRKTGNGYFQPFAEDAQAFSFDYLDSEGNSTYISADIRQVRISLTIRTEKPDPEYSSNGGYRTVKLSSFITPRNLWFSD